MYARIFWNQDHSIKNAFAVSYLAQFLLTIDAKNIVAVWVFYLKKYTTFWTVLCKKQDGGRINICETFSGNSLKEDQSTDTTFDPC